MQDFAQLFEKLSLESISLLSCRLGSLPHAVTYHCSLKVLTIRDCFLTTLPDGPYLGQLKKLDLCGNDYWTIPLEALRAPNLEVLCMIGRPLRRLVTLEFISLSKSASVTVFPGSHE